ncbi:TRAP transporter small permease [Cloacibacillus evryensis]|uniref:TRAP transporter small permease n=1 Tax=Cloacibacillus evryensis TaxID=508460 RepID=UPI00370D6082
MVLCVLEKWYKVISFLTWILMGSMCLLIGFQILNRFAFHIPAAWTEEFCRYNFVWLTMVASAKAMHDRQQLAVDIMPYLLAHKPMLKNSIKLFAQILALFFLAIIFKQTVLFCLNSIGTSCLTVRVPILYVYIILPIGFLSMFLFELNNSVETLKNFSK